MARIRNNNEKGEHPGRTYLRLLRYVRPYRTRLMVGIFFGMIFGFSHAGIIHAFREIQSKFFGDFDLELAQAFLVAGMLPLFGIVWGIGSFFSRYIVQWVGHRVVMDVRVETFSHIQDLSLSYFTHSRTGELISRTANDTMLIEKVVSDVLGDLIREPFTLIAAATYILFLNAKLAVVCLLVFPICVIPIALFGRRVRKAAKEGQQKLADLVSVMQEAITGARIVKAFCTEEREKKRFSGKAGAAFRRSIKIAASRSALEPIIVLLAIIGVSLVFVYASMAKMPLEDFYAFAIGLFVLYNPVKKISRIHVQIQQSSAAADRIFEVLDTPISVQEKENPVVLEEPIKELTFAGAGFSYDDTPVLTDLNLMIGSGEFIALVGGSGAGKTTLVSLVPRLYDLTTGQLLINGHDVKDLDLRSLRRQIGVVSQETILFNDTVANNIAYGEPDATRERIEQAARQAHAHDFIVEMEGGYDTQVGESGARLSGGQRQRLAIARALLLDPPVLLLDEATSALDTESERQVQAALDELMVGRTVIAIAHRLSTIFKADRIVVMKDGRIVEIGKHADLLEQGGTYKYLHDLQFRE